MSSSNLIKSCSYGNFANLNETSQQNKVIEVEDLTSDGMPVRLDDSTMHETKSNMEILTQESSDNVVLTSTMATGKKSTPFLSTSKGRPTSLSFRNLNNPNKKNKTKGMSLLERRQLK